MKNKLKSDKGASLLIAIVFMLFSIFVGGSVYAAASANLGRVREAAKEEQNFLSQTSAARIIAGDLQKNAVVANEAGEAVNLAGLRFSEGITLEGRDADTSLLRNLACLCASYVYSMNELGGVDAAVASQIALFPEFGMQSNAVDCDAEAHSCATRFSVHAGSESTEDTIDEMLPCTMRCDSGYNITVSFDGEGRVYVSMPVRSVTVSDGSITLFWDIPRIIKEGGVG